MYIKLYTPSLISCLLKSGACYSNSNDVRSLVIHPASTTHQQMDIEALKQAGVGEDMVRLSVGLEDAQDLIDDLSRALKMSQKR